MNKKLPNITNTLKPTLFIVFYLMIVTLQSFGQYVPPTGSRTKQLPRGIYMLKIFGAGVNATTRVMIE